MPPGTRGDPLEGLHVLALGVDVATRFAGWWLAECGADVATYRPDWRAPAEPDAEARFERQVGHATRPADFERDARYDIVIGDDASIAELQTAIPAGLIREASIVEVTSPLPTATSFSDTLLSDMALWARSGLGYLTREVDDEWQLGIPCLPLNRQASLLAGIATATAAVSAALAQRAGADPLRISCDKLELLALMPMQPVAFAQISDRIVGRDRALRYPGGTMPSADGAVYVRPVEPAHWARLFRLVGGLDWAAAEVEQEPGLLLEARDLLDERLRAWARERTSERLVADCQAEHVPASAVLRPDEVVRDEHLAARGFFRADDGAGGVNLPWLARVDGPAAPGPERQGGESVRPRPAGLPLAGLRVLDLTWAWAGPFATTMLADLGAEVVNIEWHPRASNLRRNPPYAGGREDSDDTAGWWSANQRGKLSVGVNLKEPDGRQIVRDLAARSDVVVENFSPGVVGRLGIGYEDLLESNPRLVYVSLSAFGQTGPHAHYIGYGTQLYAASGASFATSQDGETFSQMWIPYPDPVSGLVGAYAIAAYTYRARVTGRPAFVDVSELESLCCVVLEPLLAASQDDGRGSTAPSSRDGAGYVVVPTADARFVALMATEQADWIAFRQALQATDTTPAALRAAAERLDARQVLERVAEAGLVASAVHDSDECLRDPLLNERGFWIRDESPAIADAGVRIAGAIWHVDGRRAEVWKGAPTLFADTRTVLERLLDYGPGAVDDLFARGVVE